MRTMEANFESHSFLEMIDPELDDNTTKMLIGYQIKLVVRYHLLGKLSNGKEHLEFVEKFILDTTNLYLMTQQPSIIRYMKSYLKDYFWTYRLSIGDLVEKLVGDVQSITTLISLQS